MIPLEWIKPSKETPGEQVRDQEKFVEVLPMKPWKSGSTKIEETKKRKILSGKKPSSKQSQSRKRSKKK